MTSHILAEILRFPSGEVVPIITRCVTQDCVVPEIPAIQKQNEATFCKLLLANNCSSFIL